MDAFFNWLINAPVWIQTPLVLVVVIPLCALAAWVVVRAFRVVIPLSEDERRYSVVDSGTPLGGETWHSDDAADRL